jgi:pyridoxal phosphate enzyme (YggS family)
VDSLRLLKEINKQAAKLGRQINVLLQVHIAREETKFGMDEAELEAALREAEALTSIHINGLMGMASFSSDMTLVRNEFRYLHGLFEKHRTASPRSGPWQILSMGMSADYSIAIEEGSTLVRIGSLLFGARG